MAISFLRRERSYKLLEKRWKTVAGSKWKNAQNEQGNVQFQILTAYDMSDFTAQQFDERDSVLEKNAENYSRKLGGFPSQV
ncbi:unnamed protein product [Caenorhabditis brenneri]